MGQFFKEIELTTSLNCFISQNSTLGKEMSLKNFTCALLQ